MEILNFEIEEWVDPTGIIQGKRFECLLDVEVDEEDELYSEAGTQIRLFIGDDGEGLYIINYFIIDKKDGQYIELALEEEEEQQLLNFCREQIAKQNE